MDDLMVEGGNAERLESALADARESSTSTPHWCAASVFGIQLRSPL
jgi:hypothetical protein